MPSPKLSGVYSLTNTKTGNRYVGRAADLKGRKAWHFSALRKGRHTNPHIQADFNQHGQDSFEFKILQLIGSDDARIETEQTFINSPDFGYNMVRTARGGAPPATEATRAKMRASHTGKKHSPETVAKLAARPAETNGGFIGIYHTPAGAYPSAYQAEEGMGGVLNFTTIKRWCRNPDKPFCVMAYRKSAYLRSLSESVVGRTPRSLGFSFDPA